MNELVLTQGIHRNGRDHPRPNGDAIATVAKVFLNPTDKLIAIAQAAGDIESRVASVACTGLE